MPRIVMRRKQRAAVSRPQAITAAAGRLGAPASPNEPAKGFGVSLPKPSEWSEKAWDYYTRVGELNYYVNWRANAMSRAQLVAAAVDPLTGKPVAIPEDDRTGQLVANIVRSIGGDNQAAILKRLGVFLSVPGEGYVAMLVRDDRECWYSLSREEISVGGGQKFIITLPDKKKHEFDPDADLLVRIWEPDPRRSWETASAVRANLDTLQEIVRATQTIDNASNSRLIGKGILFVPDEMNLPSSATPRAERDPDNPAPAPEWQDGGAQDLQDLLFEVGTTAYKDQTSMAAMFPIVASVPGEYADKVKLLSFGTEVPDTALRTRETAMRRLAIGLDVSPERLLGMSVGNHWSAWAIGEDDVRLHLVPPLETVVDGLTEYVLKPALENRGIDPSLYCVWFDVTGMTQDPDRKAEAIAANAAGALSNAALLRYLGFNTEDGYDLDTIEGWQELARDKIARDMTLLGQLGPMAAPSGVELPEAPAALPAADSAETEPSTAPIRVPGDGQPSEAGHRVAVELCVMRALQLAGKRMLTRGNRYSVPHGTPAHEIHRHLVKPSPGDVARLTAGWDEFIRPPILAAAGLTADQLRRTVEARVLFELIGAR